MKDWDFRWKKDGEGADMIQEKCIGFFLEALDKLPQSIAMGVMMSVLTTYIETQ